MNASDITKTVMFENKVSTPEEVKRVDITRQTFYHWMRLRNNMRVATLLDLVEKAGGSKYKFYLENTHSGNRWELTKDADDKAAKDGVYRREKKKSKKTEKPLSQDQADYLIEQLAAIPNPEDPDSVWD